MPDSADDPSGDAPTRGPTLSEAFSVLADPYRRHTLYYLQEYQSATLYDLATVLTGWLEAARGGRFVGPATRDQVEVTLYHTHLPKLAAVGIVSFDIDWRLVRLRDLPSVVEALLAVARDHEQVTADNGPERTAPWWR